MGIVKTDNVSKVELRHMIAELIAEALYDPELGLDLSDWVKKRLQKKERKTVSFEDIKKKYK